MEQQPNDNAEPPAPPPEPPPPAEPERVEFSNSIRLAGREWLAVGVFGLCIVLFAPGLWNQAEKFEPGPDYRIPYDLGNDYWLYQRWSGLAAQQFDTVVIGDSVVWGDYVKPQGTLTHFLNERAGGERFANLGLNGSYPLALGGLVEHYAAAVKDKNIVLQCNPLWLTSARSDCQENPKKEEINHSRLVPQFTPPVPAYQAEINAKLGALIEQRLPFHQWGNHIQQAYYDRKSIPAWTLAHPYDNPLAPLARSLPPPEETLRHLPISWVEDGKKPADFPWIELETSLQWRAFRDTAELLRKRGNRVFVVVGPFNEHMLTPASLERYRKIQAGIRTWLTANQFPHAIPPVLPSELYGDASHPLAAGYALLAGQLWGDAGFRGK